MTLRLPLFGRILAWLLLNLIILAGAFGVFVWTELGGESLLGRIAGERSQSAAVALISELRERPIDEWERALARFEEAYPVRVLMLREDGSPMFGSRTEVPAEVLTRLRETGAGPVMEERRPGPPPGMAPEDRFGAGSTAANAGPPPARFGPRPMPGGPRIFLKAGRPARHWLVQPAPIRGPGIPRGLRLAMVSESLSAGGLFFDVRSWLWAAAAVIAVSVLWWFPFVRGITRSVSTISEATGRIAEGRFDARVPEDRGDELGRLGASINRMSVRLEGLVDGQKRFLGDVAHELCSPLARMEMALGVLEQRAEADARPYVEDVREEVRHMSALVDELLQFSKAALKPLDAERVPLSLAELTRRVLVREWPHPGDLTVQVPEELEVLGHRELIERAMGNLLRNARHHAGDGGPIRIEALAEGAHRVLWRVTDSGPGVPESELRRLGEPFYRPDRSRSSDTGGTGLGLAIVKTCIAACRGSLELANGPRTGKDRGLVATLAFESPSRSGSPTPPGGE